MLPLRSSSFRALLVVLSAIALPAVWFAQETDPSVAGSSGLFRGKDLTGWTPKIKGYELSNNFGETFRVEDGVIKVSYDQYKQFDRKYGHIFYKDKYSHYRLR